MSTRRVIARGLLCKRGTTQQSLVHDSVSYFMCIQGQTLVWHGNNACKDFVADAMQLAHNIRVHNIAEQPNSSRMFQYGPVLVLWLCVCSFFCISNFA